MIATYYHARGKYNLSFPYLAEVERSLLLRGDTARWAIVLGGLGEEYRAFNELAKADSTLRKALQLALSSEDTLAIGYVSGRLGGTMFQINDRDTNALAHYRKSIQMYRLLGDSQEIASHLGELAVIYSRQGNGRKALEILDEVPGSGYSRIIHGMLINARGLAYRMLGRHDSALIYAQEAYEILLEEESLGEALKSARLTQRSLDSLGRMNEAYEWSLLCYKLQGRYLRESSGDDLRIVNLEHDRKMQGALNEQLKIEKAAQEKQSALLKRFLLFGSVLMGVLLITVFLLLRNRSSLRRTQRKLLQLNDEVKAKNDELQNYLEVRDRMISVISHDLRAPIAALIDTVGVLKDMQMTPEEIDQVLPIVELQMKNSIDFADNLIVWVRSQLSGEAGEAVPVHMHEITLEVVEFMRPLREASSVEMVLPPTGSVIAQADKEMTKFIIRNLLHNAIKFSTRNSVIEIQIEVVEQRVRWIITDQGAGMSADQVARLFSMVSGKGNGDSKGAGIALYLSHYFAEAMNGSLTAYSEVGKGSRFILELPLNPNT